MGNARMRASYLPTPTRLPFSPMRFPGRHVGCGLAAGATGWIRVPSNSRWNSSRRATVVSRLEDRQSHAAASTGVQVDMGPAAVVRHGGPHDPADNPQDRTVRPRSMAKPGHRTGKPGCDRGEGCRCTSPCLRQDHARKLHGCNPGSLHQRSAAVGLSVAYPPDLSS